MATLTTLRANVAGALGLDNTTSPGDQGRIDGWLNDSVRDLLLRTHCHVAVATAAETNAQGDYELDTDVLAIEHVYLASGGTNYWLDPLSPSDLLRWRLNAAATSPASFYAMLGSNILLVYPTPSSADTLYFYYVPRPTELSSGSHDPSSATYGGIPVEFHYGLELYAMWKGGAYKNDENSQQGERYRLEYEGNPGARPGSDAALGFVGRMRRDLRRKAGVRTPALHVTAAAGWLPPHDRSADYRDC